MKNKEFYFKTKISKIELPNKEITKEFHLIYQSFWQSIISDIFTFGGITLAFWFNHICIGSRLFSIILALCFFITINNAFNEQKMELTPNEYIEEIKKKISDCEVE